MQGLLGAHEWSFPHPFPLSDTFHPAFPSPSPLLCGGVLPLYPPTSVEADFTAIGSSLVPGNFQ